jgi:hypothetical protein
MAVGELSKTTRSVGIIAWRAAIGIAVLAIAAAVRPVNHGLQTGLAWCYQHGSHLADRIDHTHHKITPIQVATARHGLVATDGMAAAVGIALAVLVVAIWRGSRTTDAGRRGPLARLGVITLAAVVAMALLGVLASQLAATRPVVADVLRFGAWAAGWLARWIARTEMP